MNTLKERIPKMVILIRSLCLIEKQKCDDIVIWICWIYEPELCCEV
jgi:hypothetical protein